MSLTFPHVHAFDDSGDAYDASQTELKSGEAMLIPSESVVGLADAWPIAVTKETGKLHTFKEGANVDAVLTDSGISDEQTFNAINIAYRNGFELADWAREWLRLKRRCTESRARDQLTETEALALEAMLTRTTLATLMGAVSLLCADKRDYWLKDGGCGTSAIHWTEMGLEVSRVESSARRKFGK